MINFSVLQTASFLLIFLRIFAIISVFQPFSIRTIPTSIRLLLTIAMSFILLQLYSLKELPDMNMLLALGIKEIIVGLIIGFLANIIFYMLQMVGQIIDFQVGLSLANIINPAFDIQVSPVGDLLFVLGMFIFLASGGYLQVIEAFGYSFNIVPLGIVNLSNYIFGEAFKLLGNFTLQVALRFSAPIISTILLVDIIIGIIARTVPQINIFIIGLPLKTGLAFLALIIIVGIIPDLINRELPYLIRELVFIMKGFR
ncbi:MAG: flagellar biosynthetic protein FliR [bacterium]|nr:flagellar biosynthetic protein FliR [bacterium]